MEDDHLDHDTNDLDSHDAQLTGGTNQKKKRTKRSRAWNEFDELDVPEGEKAIAVCKHCKIKVPCDTNIDGTSGMLKHLRRCEVLKKTATIKDMFQKKLIFDAASASGKDKGNLMLDTFDEKKIRYLIAQFIIADEQPFSIVEKYGFQKLVNGLEPRFRMISRWTAMRDCMGLYQSEMNALKSQMSELNPRVCLTTDTWTSVQNLTYMFVTAHFIDTQWHLHKRVIGFQKITSHTGISLSMVLENILKEWGIDKVLTITVDNASNNDKCLDELRDRQIQKYGPVAGGVMLGHQNLHMRCAAHILNLIVKEGMKEADKSMLKMRMMAKYVKSSPQREETFRQYVADNCIGERGFLQLDVCTRWNSTYIMLESVDKHRDAFESMLGFDEGLRGYLTERNKEGVMVGPGLPTAYDWDRIRTFIKFLKVFYNATLGVSASNTCTAHLFFKEVHNMKKQLNALIDSLDTFLAGMAKRMHIKYLKYWGDLQSTDSSLRLNRFFFVATILDPQCKIQWFGFWLKKIISEDECSRAIELAKTTIKELFDEYNALYCRTSTIRHDAPINDDEDPDANEWAKLVQSTQYIKQTELERYLDQGPEPYTCTILDWWKANQYKYPVIAKMARDVLAIPISTVPSESVFSTGGRVLTDFRSSLAPKTAEALICTQNWIRDCIEISLDEDWTEDPSTYQLIKEFETNPDDMLEGIGKLCVQERDEDLDHVSSSIGA